ncbi:PfkB family carbohydrate kinase [Lysinibacillus piscis]|uniref:Fructosamine kinase FrlD n=1 Tax=Lysinibacillus piscis TaxID=2518931 RepID=A0ABQ5NNZ7_9BACI|nr:PfkB family carbohydrate kinase [Lysinibacillus sp. KH24]GLC90101.1 fructosamine kinase FrlD [Lysinibacillus sp. KH24]
MVKLIAVGDNVVDCYLDKELYFPGGNCVNVAVNAKRAGAEEVSYIGIFGNDDKAEHIQYALAEEKVDYAKSRYAIGKSGQPQVSITEQGDRIFVGGPKDTVQHRFKINVTIEELNFIKDFDVCHVSVYSSMESELPKLSKVIPIAYDFSSRTELAYVKELAPYLTYAFFSAADLSPAELDEFIEALKALSIKVVGVTRGDRPALFIHDGKVYEQVLRPIQVVDTMGAGDSLIAGFLVSHLSGQPIEQAIVDGTLSAEKTCQIEGGFGYPKLLKL